MAKTKNAPFAPVINVNSVPLEKEFESWGDLASIFLVECCLGDFVSISRSMTLSACRKILSMS